MTTLPEYDFDKLGTPVRGRHFVRHWQSRRVRILDSELAAQFESSESVNEALREYLRIKRESA